MGKSKERERQGEREDFRRGRGEGMSEISFVGSGVSTSVIQLGT